MAGKYPVYATATEMAIYPVTLSGNGAAVPTKLQAGDGLTITRTGVGLYTVAVNDSHPGVIVFAAYGLNGADTPANNDRYDLVIDGPMANVRSLNLQLFNESGTLTDLASGSYVGVALFVATRTSG